MKIITNYEPLLGRIGQAAVAAGKATHDDVQAHIPRRTGHLAAGTFLVVKSLTTSRIQMAIASDVVYADAVERGANTRVKASVRAGTKRSRRGGLQAGPLLNRATRRGPHMAGSHVIRDRAPQFLERMSQEIRRAG